MIVSGIHLEVRYDLVELDEEEKAARAFVPEPEPVADFEDFESRFTLFEIYRKLYESGTILNSTYL